MGFFYGIDNTTTPMNGATGVAVDTVIDGHVVIKPDGGWVIHAANIVVSIPLWDGSLDTTLDAVHFGPPPFGSWQYYGFHSTLSKDLDPSTSYTVRVDYTVVVDSPGGWGSFDYTGNWSFTTGSSLSKPTTPSPANGSGPGIDFSNWTFSWVNGGGATAYRLFAGATSGALNLVVEQAATSYQIPVANVFRTSLLGGPIYWRVDASDGSTWVTGDEWSFDPRPAKPTTPAPTDAASDQRLGVANLGWAAGSENTVSYDVYFTGSLAPYSVAQTGLTFPTPGSPLNYDTTYSWRIDATNAWGTTTGDVWSFDTLAIAPPTTSWINLPGKTLGPMSSPTPGVVGVDFRWLGDNNMITVHRLVAAANNKIWVEDL